jgi:predicted outer membrane protein
MQDCAPNLRHRPSTSRRRTTLWLLVLSAGFLACSVCWGQSAPKPLITSDLGGRELTFLQKANEQTLVTIFLADLGKNKGESDAIRALGDLLVTTGQKELDQLNGLALTKGLTFPPGQPGMVKRLQNKLASTDKKSFDKTWIGELAAIIQASLQNMSTGAALADPEIQKFAKEGLALAQQKLEVVEKVTKK